MPVELNHSSSPHPEICFKHARKTTTSSEALLISHQGFESTSHSGVATLDESSRADRLVEVFESTSSYDPHTHVHCQTLSAYGNNSVAQRRKKDHSRI